MGQLDDEVNFLSKVLFTMMGFLAFTITAFNGVH
jgi:hypothetical protein